MLNKPEVKQRYFIAYKFIQVFLIGAIVFVTNTQSIAAQSGSQWKPDEKVPGYADDTFFTPFLVADQNKTVHAFAVQSAGENGRQWSIVYSQWNQEKGWTIPIDILFFPTGDAQIIGCFLDAKGIIHLAYLGGQVYDASIFYTSAPASKAGDVSAWSIPVLVGMGAVDPSYGAITGDDKGNIVIVYNGKLDGSGVYSVSSNDGGYSWSKTASIFLTQDTQSVPYYIKAYMGKAGKLHVIWSLFKTTISKKEFVSLYYDGLDVDSSQWSKPVLLEKKPDDVNGFFGPSVSSVVDNGQYVVVMYNSGNPYTGQVVPYGRPTQRVQISADNGQTWQGATNPFPLLTGQSGEFSMVVDSDQVVHAIFIMRIDRLINGVYSEIGGIWHSELRNNVWSNPDRFLTTINPVNLRAVVSQGNIILAIWKEDPANGLDGIWYSYTLLDIPELPIVALPTLFASSTVTPSIVNATSLPTSTPDNKPLLLDQRSGTYTPVQPILCGIIPVALVIVGTIIVLQLRGRRKNQ